MIKPVHLLPLDVIAAVRSFRLNIGGPAVASFKPKSFTEIGAKQDEAQKVFDLLVAEYGRVPGLSLHYGTPMSGPTIEMTREFPAFSHLCYMKS